MTLCIPIPIPIPTPLILAPTLLLILNFTLRTLLLPPPLPSIPYSPLSRLLPAGDLPLLGLYNLLTGRVFAFLSLQCLHLHSPIIQLFLPSFSTSRPTLVIADLDVIEEIAVKRMREIDRADLMHDWFGTVAQRATIGLKTGSRGFREMRGVWNVVQGKGFLEGVAAGCFAEAAGELVRVWEGKVGFVDGGRAFEAMEDIKMVTLDGMWDMLLGSRFGLLRAKREGLAVEKERGGVVRFKKAGIPEFYDVFTWLVTMMDWVIQGISPRMYTWIFTYTGMLAHYHKEKDRILDQQIALARQRVRTNASGRSCALDQVLLKHIRLKQGSTDNNELDDAALRDEILDLLITGHETTASTVAWAIKYLTDNPASQARLRASLTSTFTHVNYPTQPLCVSELTNASLPYLDAVIAETLRLSNTGPVSFRQTLVNCTIMGHQVPAGTPLILVTAGPSYDARGMPSTRRKRSPKSLQERHEKRLDSASSEVEEDLPSISLNCFAPERWLSHGTFVPDAVRMLPFSAGPRGCFGKKIAMLELRILIATLVMRFEFPRLAKGLSGYEAQDNLTSRPRSCYICPKVVDPRTSSSRETRCGIGPVLAHSHSL